MRVDHTDARLGENNLEYFAPYLQLRFGSSWNAMS